MKILIICLLFINCFGTRAQYTIIPDPNFETALHWMGVDPIQGDGQVLTSNIDTVTQLIFGTLQIVDLSGIEDFTELRKLYVDYNNITSLDLSSNVELTYVSIEGNSITNLVLGYLPNLTHLFCGGNPLSVSGLDLSNCQSLQFLGCGHGDFSTLNLGNHPAIKSIWCTEGNLYSLNVSNTPNLNDLRCGFNPLTEIDFSDTPSLSRFSAPACQLTELDFSNNSQLSWINIHTNPLQCVNLKNGFTSFAELYVFNTPNLTCIEVQDSTAAASWTDPGDYQFDSHILLRENCGYSCPSPTILTDSIPNEKYVVGIFDLTGRETLSVPNTTLIYVYSDGTKELIYRFE